MRKIILNPGKNIWLFGGAEIFRPLFDERLVDEMHLAVHSIVLGDGISPFRIGFLRLFQLLNTMQYPSGLVQLMYKIQ